MRPKGAVLSVAEPIAAYRPSGRSSYAGSATQYRSEAEFWIAWPFVF